MTVTVIETPAEAPAETIAEVAPVVEAIAETAPEVAQIQADRDVAIAEIQAETQEAAIEAATEIAEDQEENSEWRRNIEASLTEVRATTEGLNSQLSSIREQLTKLQPALSLPQVEESVVETPASQEAAAEPVRRKKPFRWI